MLHLVFTGKKVEMLYAKLIFVAWVNKYKYKYKVHFLFSFLCFF
jgi:hypothetical protein